ncbi:hypothetical protein Droror1_Dr00010429 [Drosera rotundifolia]
MVGVTTAAGRRHHGGGWWRWVAGLSGKRAVEMGGRQLFANVCMYFVAGVLDEGANYSCCGNPRVCLPEVIGSSGLKLLILLAKAHCTLCSSMIFSSIAMGRKHF